MAGRDRAVRNAARRRLTHALASRRDTAPVQMLRRIVKVLTLAMENGSYDPDINGEEWLVRQLPAGAVVFDVGANVGDWTAMTLRHVPDAQVHAFEIIPDTAVELDERYGEDPQVAVNRVGLSDESGTVTVTHFPGAPALSSLVPSDHPHSTVAIEVPVITGDEYCDRHDIERVTLLKVDAEGADLRVLRGFDRMLSERRIDRVQFEYGYAAIKSRDLLQDFYAFLDARGYETGKLFPNGIRFRPYSMWIDEDFIGPNYVARPCGNSGARMTAMPTRSP